MKLSIRFSRSSVFVVLLFFIHENNLSTVITVEFGNIGMSWKIKITNEFFVGAVWDPPFCAKDEPVHQDRHGGLFYVN